MRTNLGIRKDNKWFRRRSSGKEFFLYKYRNKILWWFFGAVSAIVFSYIANLLFSFGQVEELSPSSFQVTLDISAHMAGIVAEYEKPKLIDVYINIESVLVQAKLSYEPDSEREFPSIKNPIRSWRYTNMSPIVKGLRSKTSLKKLIGKTLSARIPIRVFKAKNPSLWIIDLRVYINGREILCKPDNKGHVEVQLTKENLGFGESKMDSNVVTLIIGLAGIIATLISSSLGLYFTARARSAPLRGLLYSKQIELITQIIHKQGRFRIFATLLVGDDPTYKDQAREDIRVCVKDYSELTEKVAAILPTDLWVEIKQLSSYMTELVVNYDENGKLDEKDMVKLSGMDAKVALVSRALLGVDELSNESLKLFSSAQNFERLAIIEAKELTVLAERKND